MTIVAARVTSRGLWIPRALIAAWGNIHEVEIEGRPDAVVITPKSIHPDAQRAEILDRMKAVGLIEDLSWPQATSVASETRMHLAEVLSRGKPLSEIIMEDREEYA